MFDSEILDVAVGVTFIFALVSIMCSAIREALEAWFKTRAAYLEHGIRMLLHDIIAKDGGLARGFYEHPLIRSLYASAYAPGEVRDQPRLFAKGRGLPSYIPARSFALVLMDIAARGTLTDSVSGDPAAPAISLESMRLNIRNIGNPAVQRLLLTAIDAGEGDLEKARTFVEAWYDSAMDRVSGWYKRSTQWILFWIGLALAVALNINAITIVDYLYRNGKARDAIVAKAQAAVADTAYLQRSYGESRAALDSLSLPIGWSKGWGAPRGRNERTRSERTNQASTSSEQSQIAAWTDVIAPPLGWLIIAIAVTMGAPFWFDLLNRVMVIRSTVKPHEKSPEEASEDRQRPTSRAAGGEDGRLTGGRAAKGGMSPAVRAARGMPNDFAETPDPRDADSTVDGCDVATAAGTLDEDLPASDGGVA